MLLSVINVNIDLFSLFYTHYSMSTLGFKSIEANIILLLILTNQCKY